MEEEECVKKIISMDTDDAEKVSPHSIGFRKPPLQKEDEEQMETDEAPAAPEPEPEASPKRRGRP